MVQHKLNGRLNGIATRIEALSPGLTPAEQELLAMRQRHQYQVLCRMLGCTPEDVPYADYLPLWWETGVVTYQIMNAAPAWALRELAQIHCPLILPPLERFLQRPRYVDVLWPLDHQLIPHREYVYRHFYQTILAACFQVWPQLAAQWPILDGDAQFQVLQVWLLLSNPELGEWPEDTSNGQKLDDLKACLLLLYEEYKRDVLDARWSPGMTYPYRDNPAYVLQPSGCGIEGPLTTGPDGGGVRLPPEDDTKAAWQQQCAQRLAERWACQAEAAAREMDLDEWLTQGNEDAYSS